MRRSYTEMKQRKSASHQRRQRAIPLALDEEAMAAIQTTFQAEGREPTEVELATLAHIWSEASAHRTFQATITYTDPDGLQEIFDGLLDNPLRAATEKINKPWVRSAFSRHNSGVIRFNEAFDLAFAVEMHSPAGRGWATLSAAVGGVAGAVVGAGARPLAISHSLCLGQPDPSPLAAQVARAFEAYGHRLDMTTVPGATAYHAGYTARPQLFCGCVGVLPHGNPLRPATAGDLIVLLGGKRGAAGVGKVGQDEQDEQDWPESDDPAAGDWPGGVGQDEQDEQDWPGSDGPTAGDWPGGVGKVGQDEQDEQDWPESDGPAAGDWPGGVGKVGQDEQDEQDWPESDGPAAGDWPGGVGQDEQDEQDWQGRLAAGTVKLYHAITAGGYATPIGALGTVIHYDGATVELDRLPAAYPGRRPWTLWLSEAQGWLVLAVAPERLEALQALAADQAVATKVVGVFESTGRLRLRYADQTVGDLSLALLRDGRPARRLTAVWQPKPPTTPSAQTLRPAGEALLALLAHPSVRRTDQLHRSTNRREWARIKKREKGPFTPRPGIIRRSAHMGAAQPGPVGAVVIVPLEAQAAAGPQRGVVLGHGMSLTYGALDPYAMAWAAMDAAICQVVAAGANPDEIALFTHFSWGDPHRPDRLGALVRCIQGCHDAAVAYRTPIIGSQQSLYHEDADAAGTQRATPPTLLVSAVGIAPDVTRSVTLALQHPGNALYLLGETDAEMGGSLYALLHEEQGGTPPQPRVGALHRYRALHRAIRQGLVVACHELSAGGLGVALAEMALAGRLGASIELRRAPASVAHDAILLFSESSARFLLEVPPEQEESLRRTLAAEPVARLGAVTQAQTIVIQGYGGETYLQLSLQAAEQAWRGPLPNHPW